MKWIIFLLPIVLGACASAPSKDGVPVQVVNAPVRPDFTKPIDPVDPLDAKCVELAQKAKAIAMVRDAGASMDEVELLVSPAPDYPLAPMIREVYARKDITPLNGATNSYGVCRKVTYEVMTSALVKAEQDFQAAEVERTRQALELKRKAKKPVKKPVKK